MEPKTLSEKSDMPTSTGYYWAKWRIAADGTVEGDELTPSDTWEIVQVNDNHGEGNEKFSVSVCGVQTTQWLDCFFWGEKVSGLNEKDRP
jgi:hypothetical protein